MDKKIKALRFIPFSLAAIFALVLLLCTQYTARGDTRETLNLTLDDCTKRALDNDSSIAKMNISINSLKRQYDTLAEAKDQFLDNLHSYKELYNMNLNADKAKEDFEGGEITEDQYNEILQEINDMNILLQYFAGQGILNPDQLDDDDYIIAKKFDFPMYEALNQIDDTQNNIEAEKVSVRENIRNIFDNILSLQDNINLSSRLYDKKAEDYNNTLGEFERGNISKSEKYQAEIELEESKLNIDILNRNLQNLMIDMKSRMGLRLDDGINLVPYEMKEDTNSLLSREEYVNKALAGRAEILNAENDLRLKTKEFNIIKKYIHDTSNTDYVSGNEAMLEKTTSYSNMESSIIKEVNSEYSDVISSRKALNTAKLNENSAERNYLNMQKKYESGALAHSSLVDAENSYLKAGSDSKKALMSLDEALFSLELYCGMDPE